jgi:hypothetical protein
VFDEKCVCFSYTPFTEACGVSRASIGAAAWASSQATISKRTLPFSKMAAFEGLHRFARKPALLGDIAG